MSSTKLLLLPALALLLTLAVRREEAAASAAGSCEDSVAVVTDELIHKQFGDNCSLLSGPPQFVADMDEDGIDDLVVAAKCKNPMADKDEYSFVVADPYHTFLGYGDVKVIHVCIRRTGTTRVSLLIIHGAEKDDWRAETPKAKFLLINMPFKTLVVKRLTIKREQSSVTWKKGRGENISSVIFGTGRPQISGSGLDPRVAQSSTTGDTEWRI